MNIRDQIIAQNVEPTNAIKEIRNYLAGRAVGISRDEALLEEVLKVLFALSGIDEADVPEDSLEFAKLVRTKFSQVKGELREFYQNDDELLLDPESIFFVSTRLLQLKRVDDFDEVAALYQAFIGNQVGNE